MSLESLEPKPPFRWSFSQFENYSGCPARWKFKSVLKLPSSPPGPAAARGLDMHDRCDKYIMGQIDQTALVYGTPEMRFGDKKPAVIHEKYIPILDAYRNHPGGDRHTEKKVAFDAGWSLCSPLSSHAACIAVLDAVKYTARRYDVEPGQKVLDIGEWKSGSPKDTHADQRHLYAMFGLKTWLPDVVRVTTYYLEDTATPVRLMATADNFEKMRDKWQGRIELMQRDEICAPRPGVHCRWCDYAKAKGGPCAFGS